MTRRQFLMKSSVAALALPMIVPRHVLGGEGYTPPSAKITLGGIGIGGVGHAHLKQAAQAGFEVVALCDIDELHAKKSYDLFPQARRYRDFRALFSAEQARVDAIYCGTPDHTHALITLAALRAKKHVCCVKPLTRTIEECRCVAEAARQAGTATQVTTSPNTGEAGCRITELIQAGAIGAVREVHIWSNRPVWPQGMPRYPTFTDPVPATFDWPLWLGPALSLDYAAQWPEASCIPDMPNHNWGGRRVFHPFNFRGWVAFGSGALGDMGCHHANNVMRALNLTYPTRVSASTSRNYAVSYPLASVVTYDFPARGHFPECRVVWYDGGLRPPAPKELGDKSLPEEGVLYYGDQGVMLDNKILTKACAEKFANLPKTLIRRGNVFAEWMTACQGGEKAGCHFDWAVPLTEFVLLGNLAIQTGKSVAFDPVALKITNNPEADARIRQPYHNGWSLQGTAT